MRVAIAHAGVALGLLSLAACGAASSDALSSPGSDATVCVPVGSDNLAVIGLDALVNDGEEPATVTGIELVDADGIELVGGTLVLNEGDDAVTGAWTGGEEGRVDQTYAPVAPEEQVTVQVTVRMMAKAEASAEALRVSYESGGDQGTVETKTSILLAPAGAVCRREE